MPCMGKYAEMQQHTYHMQCMGDYAEICSNILNTCNAWGTRQGYEVIYQKQEMQG